MVMPGNTNIGGRLGTVDLLIKVACFVKEVNDIFKIKRSWSKLEVNGTEPSPFSKTSLAIHKNSDYTGEWRMMVLMLHLE